MGNKVFTVAILGCGSRGGEAYGRKFYTQSDRYRIVAICDRDPRKLEKWGREFGLDGSCLFGDEADFLREKRADLLVIATLDRDHVRECLAGLALGYDILLEKPITDSAEECRALLAAQKKYGGRVLVCHVLRYAKGFMKVKELLDGGKIGQLVSMQALEQVAYFHEAHSYVRGNWRRSEDTTPMILAKCCHDLDLLQDYAGARCKSVSSVGNLFYFRPENMPSDATLRCLDCPRADTCPYSAKRIYLGRWEAAGKPENIWPQNVFIPTPLTREGILEALKTTPYGRCVFACDNDVVDHQVVSMMFENGVSATLTMTAFTAAGGRIMRFFGTLGEIVLDEEADTVTLKRHGEPRENYEVFRISALAEGGFGHGGGDSGIVDTLYEILEGRETLRTGLAASLESHLMGIASEMSRVRGGETVFLDTLR